MFHSPEVVKQDRIVVPTSEALLELFLEATSSCSSCMDPDIEAVRSLSSMSVKVTFDLASSNAAVAVDVISANSEEGSCESIPDD